MARKTPLAADDSTRFARLTEEAIETQTDLGSVTRGSAYRHDGRIHGTILRDTTIEGLCDGTEPSPYHVWATLAVQVQSGANPRDYDCTCPRGGFCKHIVALLLTWVHSPEQFIAQAPFADRLGGKTREELVALIERMVKRYPDLESLMEIPLPVPGASGQSNLDEKVFRRQVRAAIGNTGPFEWGVDPGITRNLDPLLQLGQQYAEAAQWANARVVFTVLAQEACEWMRSFQDDEGEMSGIVVDCDEGLAACLDVQTALPEHERLSAEARKRLIEAIYDIWHVDIFELGGLDISREGPEALARYATDDERAIIESWLWDEHIDKTDGWKQRARIGLISLLREESGLDDEALLKLYEDAELWSDVAHLLLEMGHIEKAIVVARHHFTSANAYIGFADLLIELHGDHADRAILLIEDHLWETEGGNAMKDSALQGWLVDQLGRHGRPVDALKLAEQRFMRDPTYRNYLEARDTASLPGQKQDVWNELRPRLEHVLEERESWGVLVDVYLRNEDVRAALDAFAKRNAKQRSGVLNPSSWGTPGQNMRLAQAAETDFPDEAVGLYRDLAERMIQSKNRSSYKVAAEHLSQAKSTLERDDRTGEWKTLISDLREQHKTLRALRDELDKAGL